MFTDADLAGISASGEIDLRGADLAGANLRQANLRAAQAERATFSHANLFATDFRDARLHGVVFEGSRIDDRTAFGDQVIYHTEAQEATDPDTELDRLEGAISLVLGLVFPVLDLRHATAGQLPYRGAPGEVVRTAVFGILYSRSAFTALGQERFTPGPLAEALAVGEAGVGILMFGLLLFVLQRRTTR